MVDSFSFLSGSFSVNNVVIHFGGIRCSLNIHCTCTVRQIILTNVWLSLRSGVKQSKSKYLIWLAIRAINLELKFTHTFHIVIKHSQTHVYILFRSIFFFVSFYSSLIYFVLIWFFCSFSVWCIFIAYLQIACVNNNATITRLNEQTMNSLGGKIGACVQ